MRLRELLAWVLATTVGVLALIASATYSFALFPAPQRNLAVVLALFPLLLLAFGPDLYAECVEEPDADE